MKLVWLGSALLLASVLTACSLLIESGDATYASTSSPATFVIESSTSHEGDNFGTAIALEDDQLIVVASTADLAKVSSSAPDSCGRIVDATDAGRIHLFQLNEEVWDERDELKRPSAESGDGIIKSDGFIAIPRISLVRSGRTAVIGVPAAEHSDCDSGEMAVGTLGPGAKQAGKVYVFELDDDGRWHAGAVLTASKPDSDQFFGSNLAISGDFIFIGAPGDDGMPADPGSEQEPEQSGAVYVFVRDGETYREQQRLKPSNPIELAHFGSALSVDGDTLAVGAWFDANGDDEGVDASSESSVIQGSGAAYVFRERDGTWEQEAFIKAFNRDPGDLFGVSVAVQGDTLVVGASGERGSHTSANIRSTTDLEDLDSDDMEGAGAVYAFHRDADGWRFTSYLKAFEPRSGATFGTALSFEDGRLLVGAPFQSVGDRETGEVVLGAGAAYLFDHNEGSFTAVISLQPNFPRRETFFGFSVDLEGDFAAIGGPENVSERGSVNVFDLRAIEGE